MGNSTSSHGRGHNDDTVDFGYLTPQGVYTGPQDWNHAIVTQLICERKLAPFYRPLEDYQDTWDDDQILAARKDPPETETSHSETARHDPSHYNGSKHPHVKRPTISKEGTRCPDAAIYRGATECPICFLYYPPNINHSRCCDQAICTECFVQIKRADPTATHIVSEPAACPYCVQDNFGIVYTPPVWRAGIGSDGTVSPQWPDSPKSSQHPVDTSYRAVHKRRQKSFGHDSPEVVTTDCIRPDWEAKLAAVRATAARRANRRIIMRQVGDRLIPVGVTSGRLHAISPEEAGQSDSSDNGGSRRPRRQRAQNQDLSHLLGPMGLGGQDLEELMIMEAMRLSLVEHEEHQRREAENREQNNAETTPTSDTDILLATRGSDSHLESRPPTPAPLSMLAPPIAPVPTSSIQPFSTILHDHSGSTSNIEGITPKNRSLTPISALRKRTPSPIHPLSESSSNWRRRSSSPRTFNTIAAAMSSTSTATAILANKDTTIPGDDNTSPPSGRSSAPPVANNPEAAARYSPRLEVAGIPIPRDSDDVGTPRRPPIPIETDSYASSIFSTESTSQTARSPYDVLSSSPDSEFAREPLLGSSPVVQTVSDAGTDSREIVSSRVVE